MKKLYLFITLIFLGFSSLIAQNWAPITVDGIHHYQESGVSFITHTIKTDSTQNIGGEDVFFLNRIAEHCDTCSYDPYISVEIIPGCSVEPTGGIINPNAGQFLQKDIVFESEHAYFFNGDHPFLLFSQAGLNDIWLSDTLQNISATVTSLGQETIFGSTDSVKTISYSDGRALILSKNHGITAFEIADGTIFNLMGIENQGLGEKPKGFDEIYNFEVGNVFQIFKEEKYSYDYCETDLIKRTVLAKTVLPDEFIYEVERVVQHSHCGWTPYSSIDTITINFERQYAGYLALPPNAPANMDGYSWLCSSDLRTGTYSRHHLDANGLFSISLGSTVVASPWEFESPQNFIYDPGAPSGYFPVLYPMIWYEPELDALTYKEGLGLTNHVATIFESSYEWELIGYVKNGDTTGTIYSNLLLLPIEETVTAITDVKVFPNPANESATITIEGLLPNSDYQLELFTIIGQKVRNIRIATNELEIHKNELPAGVYFLTINDEFKNVLWSGKLVFY